MGGTLSVTSEVGVGTTFTFNTMLVCAAAPRAAAEVDSLKGRRVLCVDDNATNRYVLGLTLAHWGIDVVMCAEPQECLQHASGGSSFDWIVLDHQMPNASGDDVAREIRAALARTLSADRLVDVRGARSSRGERVCSMR